MLACIVCIPLDLLKSLPWRPLSNPSLTVEGYLGNCDAIRSQRFKLTAQGLAIHHCVDWHPMPAEFLADLDAGYRAVSRTNGRETSAGEPVVL
jgi:hypothetical protein